jgi:PadR family transcriptional regulator PadR
VSQEIMLDMAEAELTELCRGVLGPCVRALLESRPRFGLELVRDLANAGGVLTSDGTVYPLLSGLRDDGLVTLAPKSVVVPPDLYSVSRPPLRRRLQLALAQLAASAG